LVKQTFGACTSRFLESIVVLNELFGLLNDLLSFK
jgi:hypothetical protein